MASRTIQARISDDTSREIMLLKNALGIEQVTEVIKLAIHRFAQEYLRQKSQQTPFEAMEELHLIGSIKDANPILSQDYKTILSESFRSKHAAE